MLRIREMDGTLATQQAKRTNKVATQLNKQTNKLANKITITKKLRKNHPLFTMLTTQK